MKYVGYVYAECLPIKAGMAVTIKKGTPVSHRGETKPAGRTYKVKVDHVLCGMERYGEVISNPSVRWPGTGGYWSEVDINFIPEAQ